MTCKGCNRAVYDTDVDQDGLCCFCSPAGENLTGVRDVGEGTPVTLHGTETVDLPPEPESEEPRKGPRRKRSVLG